MNLNPYEGNFTYRIKGTELPNKKPFIEGVHKIIEEWYEPLNEALVNYLQKYNYVYSECVECEEFGDYVSRHKPPPLVTRAPKLTKGKWD